MGERKRAGRSQQQSAHLLQLDDLMPLTDSFVKGTDQDETGRLIGCVVASEIFDSQKRMEPYDENRYVTALRKLPALPE
jgi:hypothetical protein